MGHVLQFSIGSKLVGVFALLILGFSAVLFNSLGDLRALEEAQEREFEQHYQRLSQVQQLRVNLALLQATLMRALVAESATELDNIEQAIERGSAENNHLTDSFQQFGRDDGIDAVVARIVEERNALVAGRGRLLELVRAGNLAAARALSARDQLPRLQRIDELGSQLAVLTDQRVDDAVTASRQGLEATRERIFMQCAALVAISILAALWLSRHIAQPLGQLTTLAQQISRGEIPRHVDASARRDEVGSLTQAFADMSRYLREMVQEINESIAVLASSTEEILAATSQTAAGTQETATAISEIATTIEEVKQTAVLASDRSQVVTESAERTRQVAQEGFQAVDEVLKGMQNIREQALAVAESIMRLGDQTQAIGEIVAAVGDLAEQSNLLGVNASIEAVKAGEAGKGFSVVAQEVKALADQSKQATAQVRGILGDVQKAMTKTVMLAEQGSKSVEVGYERAQTGGNAIRTLGASVDESSEVALQIAATSQQQMAGMDQIAKAMEYISQASQDNVGGTRQVDIAARNLHQLGLKLKGLTGRFSL